jgi:hypothetical protein
VYETPGGDRILLGAERRFFVQSLASIVDLLAHQDVEFGVTAFDELQRSQKLVALYKSSCALLQPNEPKLKLTAYVESAVAIVYEHARERACDEIDNSSPSQSDVFWRRLILEALREQLSPDDLPPEADDDKEGWAFWVECLAGCVLWDNDYESQQSLDLPPEESRRYRALLGMADDYYTDVPPDPPDDQVNLYIDALMGLTADAR